MKILNLVVVLFITVPVFSQSLSKKLLASAGSTGDGNSAVVSWSLGEIVISTTEVHQGYQFPPELSDMVTGIEELFKEGIKIFPNPTLNTLNLILDPSLAVKEVSLTGVHGRKFETILPNNNDEISLDLSQLTPGIYFIRLSDKSGKSRTFKVVKK